MSEQQRPAVVIVGSSGLIGSHLVHRFAGEFQVFALDLKEPEGPLPTQADFVQVDVTSAERVREAMNEVNQKRNGSLASIVHLAAYYDFSGEPSDQYEKLTVRGTQRVVRAAREASAAQFVFSSTMLVHEPTTPGEPFDEAQPLEGKWDYPRSKIAAERVIEAEHGNLSAVLLRIAGVYSDTCDSLPLSHQIQRIYERRLTATVFPGDTRCGQAFVHVEDLVDAFWRTVTLRDQLPKGVTPILIGEPETPGYADLQREIARQVHNVPNWTTHEVSKTLAKSGTWIQDKVPGVEQPFIRPWMIDLADDHYELNIERARQLLGWSPKHRVIKTIPKMTRSLTRDPEAWYRRHGLPVPAGAGGYTKR